MEIKENKLSNILRQVICGVLIAASIIGCIEYCTEWGVIDSVAAVGGSIASVFAGVTNRDADVDDFAHANSQVAEFPSDEELASYYASKVYDMSGIFAGCESVETVDLSGWDTGRVTDMSYMFAGYSDCG